MDIKSAQKESVLSRYIPSRGALRENLFNPVTNPEQSWDHATRGYDGLIWPFIANFSTSLTSFEPRFGHSRNTLARAEISQLTLEAGAKSSESRTDRKLLEILPICVGGSNRTVYRASFGAPPAGTRWAAFQLSLLPFRINGDIVVDVALPNGRTLRIRRLLSNFHWSVLSKMARVKSQKFRSGSFDLDFEFGRQYSIKKGGAVIGGLPELNISVCIEPSKATWKGGAAIGSCGIRWAVAYALTSEVRAHYFPDLEKNDFYPLKKQPKRYPRTNLTAFSAQS